MYVNKHIKKLNNEIRLAKLFCKANDVYGAESYINGFSGYILEILIIKYGGFLQMLKAISKWKPKQVVDIENYFKGKNVLKKLNSSKTHGPLIVIDPVQKDRNAAAALNIEKFSKMIFLAKLFLESPDKEFFEKKKFDVKDIKAEAKDGYEATILKIKPLKGKRDVVGTKILRVMNLIKKQIELNEFKIFDNGFDWEEGKDATVWFLTYPNKLPKYKKHQGPKVYSNEKNIFDFIDKHEEIMLDEFTICAKVKRKHIDVKSLVKAIIKEDFIKDKVRKILIH
jgi:tRNA nucleotidyltransferase (CCA-adding enzyme)